jgi:hypothetical protein
MAQANCAYKSFYVCHYQASTGADACVGQAEMWQALADASRTRTPTRLFPCPRV